MTRLLLATVAWALLLAGCSGEAEAPLLVPDDHRPPPSSVEVDTPELRDLKAQAGIADCAPGPGGGGLPAVTVSCLGGGTALDLASLRGPMIINFWQTQCVACEQEMPILQAFHERYGDAVAVLGVDSADRYPGTALEQLMDRGVTYPQLADPGGDLQDTEAFAKIRYYPYLAFVDDTGAITYEKFGAVESADELRALVEEHLAVTL